MDDSLKKNFETALELSQQGKVDTAIPMLEDLLVKAPQDGDLLHALGMAFAQRRDFNQALHYMTQAIQFAPQVAEFHNNLANVYKVLNQLPLAQRHYQEALRLKSPYPQAHNNLGALLYKIGNYNEAINHFQKSLSMDPGSVDTHYNLANAYIQQDRFLDAKAHYEEVLKRRPEHLGALHNLGITLCVLKRFSEAKPLLEQVIQREPDNIDALYHLGVIASGLADHTQARDYFSQVLAIDSNHANSHHNLATAYLSLNERELALKHFKAAFSLEPNNQTAAHMIASLEGKTLPEGAPKAFTRALFDQYAYSYDEHVKKQLNYQVPSLLRQAISPYISERKRWDTLDLGCGSGLCAPLFADLVTKMTGVDLSPNMLEVAKMHGGYDALYCDDALSFLNKQSPATYDLIIAADVFVYFGSLQDIFTAIHRALSQNGYFCFSIETLIDAKTDYQLTATGRYTHQIAYVEKLLAEGSLDLLSQTPATLRTQEDVPVLGHIFTVQKR
ncbi:MAG: tetratricopeptide repeat protein [Candidatus Berkiella sp.]